MLTDYHHNHRDHDLEDDYEDGTDVEYKQFSTSTTPNHNHDDNDEYEDVEY